MVFGSHSKTCAIYSIPPCPSFAASTAAYRRRSFSDSQLKNRFIFPLTSTSYTSMLPSLPRDLLCSKDTMAQAVWEVILDHILSCVVTGGAGADQRVRGIVTVERPAFPVVPDQGGVRLDGIGDVRREQRITPLGGQLHGILASRTTMPDSDRPLQWARPGLGLVSRRR